MLLSWGSKMVVLGTKRAYYEALSFSIFHVVTFAFVRMNELGGQRRLRQFRGYEDLHSHHIWVRMWFIQCLIAQFMTNSIRNVRRTWIAVRYLANWQRRALTAR